MYADNNMVSIITSQIGKLNKIQNAMGCSVNNVIDANRSKFQFMFMKSVTSTDVITVCIEIR